MLSLTLECKLLESVDFFWVFTAGAPGARMNEKLNEWIGYNPSPLIFLNIVMILDMQVQERYGKDGVLCGCIREHSWGQKAGK